LRYAHCCAASPKFDQARVRDATRLSSLACELATPVYASQGESALASQAVSGRKAHNVCACACDRAALMCKRARTRASTPKLQLALEARLRERARGLLCTHSVCVCACMQTRMCVPAPGCLRAHPSSSLPCMQHPSIATEKPSGG